MSLTAFLHGYPPFWSMGGELSTHRTLRVAPDAQVFTNTAEEYELDGVRVRASSGASYQNIMTDAEAGGASTDGAGTGGGDADGSGGGVAAQDAQAAQASSNSASGAAARYWGCGMSIPPSRSGRIITPEGGYMKIVSLAPEVL